MSIAAVATAALRSTAAVERPTRAGVAVAVMVVIIASGDWSFPDRRIAATRAAILATCPSWPATQPARIPPPRCLHGRFVIPAAYLDPRDYHQRMTSPADSRAFGAGDRDQ